MFQVNEVKALFIRAMQHDRNQAVPRALEASRAVIDQVQVLCWNLRGLPLDDFEVIEGVPIWRFGFPVSGHGLRTAIGILWYQIWVFGHILSARPRLVQAFDLWSAVPAALGRLLLGYRFVYDMRDPFALSFGFSPLVRKVAYLIDWVVMGLSSGFVVPDDCRIPYLGRWARSRRPVVTIKNTCHDELERVRRVEGGRIPPGDGQVRIAYVGHISYARGARHLVDLCKDAEAAVELWVAGTCSPAWLEEKLKAAPNVRFWGTCSWLKSMALMRAADIVAILYDPSVPVNRLAAPNKLYEALMLGTPVLACKGTHLAEDIRQEGLGYVVEYGDFKALRGVAKNLRDRQQLARMRERCRTYFLHHLALARELRKYRAFYRRLTHR